MLPAFLVPGPAAADIVNSAFASGIHDGGLVQSGGAQVAVAVPAADPGLSLTVEAAMTGETAPGLPEGDTVGYSIAIENTGDVGLVAVRLALELKQGEETFTPTDAPRYEGGDFENPGVLDRGETWRFSASYALERVNLEIGGAIEATLTGTGRFRDRTVSAGREVATPVPTLQGVERSYVSLAHTPSAIEADLGDQVDYTLTVSNRSVKPVTVRLRALLSAGTSLVPGSVLSGGEVADVAIDGQRIDFGAVSIPPLNNVSLRYLGEISVAAERGYHVNMAQIADPDTLIPLMPPSPAAVRTSPFIPEGCTEISLLVYEDDNRNGFADTDERGISGARVSPASGNPMTTDLQGQFSSPCLEVSRLGEIGLDFELDEATLPEGYHATTPNPLAVRLQAGSDVSVSFGVASARVLRVDLNAAAFRRNETVPDEDLSDGITRLISVLQREPSVLRLTYYANREKVDLPEERLERVRQAILERWTAAGGAYDLEIETRVVHGNG